MVKHMATIKEQTKHLWQLCFQDSIAFTELYFEKRYRDERNLSIERKGQVVAALQLLPYPMSFYDTVVPMNYISGACTHPDFRNQGLMSTLLQQALETMLQRGSAFTTLIPAEPWLFDYYARFGYAPVFQTCDTAHQNHSAELHNLQPDEEVTCIKNEEELEEITQWMDKVYKKQYDCSVLHSSEDLQVVYASQLLDGGHTYILKRRGRIQAVAFATPTTTDNWRIEELLAIDPQSEVRLLQYIYHIHQASEITLTTSYSTADTVDSSRLLGMARILQVHKVLQIYAQKHQNLELHLQIEDKQIPMNNGYYMLTQGQCKHCNLPFTESYISYTVGELSRKLLAPLHPHMSLMLN